MCGVFSWRGARGTCALRRDGRSACTHVDRALLALAFATLAQTASADCRLELELMSADLRGVKLTQAQSQELAALVDEVLKRCRMGWEQSALEYITKARAAAGIPRRDWLDDPETAPDEQAPPAR